MAQENYQKSMGGPCACESIRYVDCGLSVACIIVASAFVTCFEICLSMFGCRVAACPGMVWKEMNMGVALSLIRREDWIRCLMEGGIMLACRHAVLSARVARSPRNPPKNPIKASP